MPHSTAGVVIMHLATVKFKCKPVQPGQSSIQTHLASTYSYATDYVAQRILSIDTTTLSEMQVSSFVTDLNCDYKLGKHEYSVLCSLQGGNTAEIEDNSEEEDKVAPSSTTTNRKRGRPLGSVNKNARKKNKSKSVIVKDVSAAKENENENEEAEARTQQITASAIHKTIPENDEEEEEVCYSDDDEEDEV